MGTTSTKTTRKDGRPSICLTMIVKNEAAVLERCFRSVRPFIDCWSIVDTGSSDGTQELVQRSLSDIPGKLHERPWKDFGHNRTEALELARPLADYLFVIDADETFEVPDGFCLPSLNADAYYTQHRARNSSVSFSRVQLVRSHLPFRYEGVLHEVVVCDAPHRKEHIKGAVCVGGFDGARNQVSPEEKYGRDAQVLEEALKDEPNNARYRYYLARSYRDAGQPLKAIENFLIRAEMGGFDEEVWHSLHLAGTLSAELGKYHAALATQLQAYQLRPQRAETLCALARLHRMREEHHLAYLFARQAASIPRPDDLLFVDDSVYSWRSLDEWSISAYWVGQYQESLDAAMALLRGNELPENQRERVENNKTFAEAKLKPVGSSRVRLAGDPKVSPAPQNTARVLRDLIPLDRPLRILDIGASPVDGDPPYQALLDTGEVELVSFEPNPNALAQLRAQAGPHQTILGEALGDGKRHTLHFCQAPGMNSLLTPDPNVLGKFNLFGEFGTVLRTEEIETYRLDDLDEVGTFDFVKLDVQGFEKTILEHGRKRIAQCLVVHTEAAFVPMYRDQPCLGEVDTLLRELGFVTHTIFSLKRWPVAPLIIDGQPRRGLNQLLDGDLVYARNFFELKNWSDSEVARLAHILHTLYRSYDVTYHLMRELEQRGTIGPVAATRYLELVGLEPSSART